MKLFLLLSSAIAAIASKPNQDFHNDINENLVMCTMQYQPVCGHKVEDDNLKTFGNKCLLSNNKTFGYLHQGECLSDTLFDYRMKPDNLI